MPGEKTTEMKLTLRSIRQVQIGCCRILTARLGILQRPTMWTEYPTTTYVNLCDWSQINVETNYAQNFVHEEKMTNIVIAHHHYQESIGFTTINIPKFLKWVFFLPVTSLLRRDGLMMREQPSRWSELLQLRTYLLFSSSAFECKLFEKFERRQRRAALYQCLTLGWKPQLYLLTVR